MLILMMPFRRLRWIGELNPRPPLTAESFWMWFGFDLLSCSANVTGLSETWEWPKAVAALPSRCVFTMSRRRFSAMKISKKMRKSSAQAPMAPTISGKNDDCPFESSLTGLIVGWVVVGGDVGSDGKIMQLKIRNWLEISINSLNVRPMTMAENSDAVNDEKLWILNS